MRQRLGGNAAVLAVVDTSAANDAISFKTEAMFLASLTSSSTISTRIICILVRAKAWHGGQAAAVESNIARPMSQKRQGRARTAAKRQYLNSGLSHR
jgi:hypothetical protein